MQQGCTCAIYARYSSAGQSEASIRQQVDACKAVAMRDGYELMKAYTDSAKSGTSTDRRDGLAQLVRDASRGRFMRVYVWKYDRIARNRYDAAQIRQKLKRCKVDLISITETVGNGNESVILESVLDGMAEYYSLQLSQNVKRGIENNARQCKANGRRIYGYTVGKDGRYEIDETRAPIVQALFMGALSGDTVKATLSRFEASIRPSKYQCSAILRNEAYTGTYDYDDVRVPHGMPQIVDSATFEAVQDVLAKRKHKTRRSRYALSGLLFTLDGTRCKSASGTSHDGTIHRYYRDPIVHVWHRVDALESAIVNACKHVLCFGNTVNRINSELLALRTDLNTTELLVKELESKRLEYSNIFSYPAKPLDNTNILSHAETIEQTINRLECALSNNNDSYSYLSKLETIHDASRHEIDTLASHITRVFISGDGHIIVYFCFNKEKEPPKYLDGSTLFAVVRHTGFKRLNDDFTPFYLVLRDTLLVLAKIQTRR